jgi:replicative DNA helicase
MTMQRSLPHDQAAERALLGAILRDRARFDEAATVVSADDFYTTAHRLIFGVMAQAREHGDPLDSHVLAARLKHLGQINDVGPAYFIELWDYAPCTVDVPALAKIVRTHASARALISACNDILTNAYESPMDSRELIEDAERLIFAIAQRDLRTEPESNDKVMAEAMDLLDRRVDRFRLGEDVLAASYGLKALDAATAGLHPGELTVIGARPGVGKTIFGCHLADVSSSRGQPALFVSLEQARAELALRLVAKHAQVNAFKLRSGSVSNNEKLKIVDAVHCLRSLPLWWDDTPCQTITRIGAQARRLKAKNGLALLVVDYMQLIDHPNKRLRRYEAVGEMSRGLKLLARELQIPVVAMAQLNREPSSAAASRS